MNTSQLLYKSDLPGEGFFDGEKTGVSDSGGGLDDDDSQARAAAATKQTTKNLPKIGNINSSWRQTPQ